MNEDSVVSADYKTDKNGRKYRIRKRNIKGTDTPQQGQLQGIQDPVQENTKTRNTQMENITFKEMSESIDDEHLLQTLANRDINASIKNGEVHVHERNSVGKAKRIVKNLGLSHRVVQGKLQEETDLILDENFVDFLLEMSNSTFTGLVKGYIQHKKRAKNSGFKPMTFDQFHSTVKKIGTIKERFESSSIDEQISMLEQLMEEKESIKLPNLKPRDPNYLTLLNKKNAAGKHRDKKKRFKNGNTKYRGKDE